MSFCSTPTCKYVAGWKLGLVARSAFLLAFSAACVTDLPRAQDPLGDDSPPPTDDAPEAIDVLAGTAELRIDDQVVEIEAAFLTSAHARNKFYWLTVVPRGIPHLDQNAFVRLVTPGYSWSSRSMFWPYHEEQGRLTALEDDGIWLNAIGESVRSCRVTREEAQILAGLLEVPLSNILEPTYRLEGELIVSEKPYHVGEPIWLTLRVTNVGDTEVLLLKGGWQRGASRHHRFDWVIRFRGTERPDTGGRDGFGGLAIPEPIAPGGWFNARVDVSKWADFSRPGHYELQATYHLEVLEPVPVRSIPQPPLPDRTEDDGWSDPYDDELIATTVVTVIQ